MKNVAPLRLALIGCLLLAAMATDAQTVSLNELNGYVQKVRVALLDEFMSRFNGQTTHPDLAKGRRATRKDNLLLLCNLSMFKSTTDSRFREAGEMMDTVISDSVQLHYNDSTWAALAHCKATMGGKTVDVDLLLTVQHRREDMYKWVIADADGKLFDITPRNTNEANMIMPDDHETNFLSLRRLTSEQPWNISQFLARDVSYDRTSVFAYLVHSGRLKIDHVADLEFIFTQVPGYIFHVGYIEREKNNAGWLITKFSKVTDKQKQAFLKKIHRQPK